MTIKILENITIKLDRPKLIESMRIAGKPRLVDDFTKMLDEAEATGKPKALFKKVFIEKKGDDFIMLDGIKLKSRVLRVNLDKTDVAFPALATCGLELEDWANSKTDMLQKYWAETINENILSIAVTAIFEQLDKNKNSSPISLMTPGSLNDWPMSEQENLFSLFESSHQGIGVTLSESFLMHPLKTISCVLFRSEKMFQSCQLCSRGDCLNRRAPFEKDLFETKYKIATCENPENG